MNVLELEKFIDRFVPRDVQHKTFGYFWSTEKDRVALIDALTEIRKLDLLKSIKLS